MSIPTPEMTPKVTIRSSNKIWSLFDEYRREVEESNYSNSSKIIYVYFAECFVRWLDGDFEVASHVG